MPSTPAQLRASGTIRPCRFVKISGNFTCAEADANEDAIGISYQDGKYPPLNDLVTSNPHAENGDPVRLYVDGDICLLTYATTITAGQRLKSDADGQGTPTTGAGDLLRAIALEGGSVGENRMVLVQSTARHS